MSGSLYLISIPIGNMSDLTFRAKRTLRSVDIVVGEEFKNSKKLLDLIDSKAELMKVTEHNEKLDAGQIIELLLAGKDLALISDTGTPVLADPGSLLVQKAIQNNIKIVPIPGPASPLAALVISGFKIHRWVYRGFLSPKKEQRSKQLEELKKETLTSIIMEAPYRLQTLLEAIIKVLEPDRRIALCWQLTMPDERIFRGNCRQVLKQVRQADLTKGEFVLVLQGYGSSA